MPGDIDTRLSGAVKWKRLMWERERCCHPGGFEEKMWAFYL